MHFSAARVSVSVSWYPYLYLSVRLAWRYLHCGSCCRCSAAQTAARQLNDLRQCATDLLHSFPSASFPSTFLSTCSLCTNGKSCRQNGIIKMTFLAGKTHKIINRPEHPLDIWHGKGLKNILYTELPDLTLCTELVPCHPAAVVLNCFCGKTQKVSLARFNSTPGTAIAILRLILIRFEVFLELRTRKEGK